MNSWERHTATVCLRLESSPQLILEGVCIQKLDVDRSADDCCDCVNDSERAAPRRSSARSPFSLAANREMKFAVTSVEM